MATGIVNRLPALPQDTTRTTATTAAAEAVAASEGGKLFVDLPATPAIGQRDFITDSNSTTFLAVAAGGGTDNAPVVYDGTNWLIG